MFKQKKLSHGARFGLSVASFVLGLLLFFTAIATALLADVQIVTSQDGLSGIIRTMMSAPAQVRPHAPATILGEDGLRVAPRANRTYQMPHRDDPDADAADGVAADLTDQLIGMFYEQMGEMFGEEITFTQEEFTQMVNDSTVKDYIADKTAGLITDYLNDEITTTFEAEEVVQLIHENSELIESITGEPIPENISEEIGKVFDENEIIVKVEAEGLKGFMELIENSENTEGEEGASSGGGLLEILETAKEYYGIVSPLASTSNLIIGIFICLVLIAGIIFINCRQLGKGLRRAGYPLVIAGLGVVLNILATSNPDMWVVSGIDDAATAATTNMILKLVRHILTETAVVNIVVFGTGLVLFISGIVLGIVLRPKKSPVFVPSTPEAEELAAAVVDETPVEILPEVTEEESTQEEPIAEETEAEIAPIGE